MTTCCLGIFKDFNLCITIRHTFFIDPVQLSGQLAGLIQHFHNLQNGGHYCEGHTICQIYILTSIPLLYQHRNIYRPSLTSDRAYWPTRGKKTPPLMGLQQNLATHPPKLSLSLSLSNLEAWCVCSCVSSGGCVRPGLSLLAPHIGGPIMRPP